MSMTKTSICIDGQILEQAKKLKLNVSLITREALAEAVNAAEKARLKTELAEAYSADAQIHKEISDDFKSADKAW